MNKKYCINCGYELGEKDIFCVNCGTPVLSDTSANTDIYGDTGNLTQPIESNQTYQSYQTDQSTQHYQYDPSHQAEQGYQADQATQLYQSDPSYQATQAYHANQPTQQYQQDQKYHTNQPYQTNQPYKAHQPYQANKPKSPGMSTNSKVLLICGGALLLILLGFGIWFFMFRDAEPNPDVDEPVVEVPEDLPPDDTLPEPMPQVESVAIIYDSAPVNNIALFADDIITLRLEVNPDISDAEVFWLSSNPDVLDIVSTTPNNREATVMAISPGRATLTVTVEGVRTICVFDVIDDQNDEPIPVEPPIIDEPPPFVSDVEGELARIREIWTESRLDIDNGRVQPTGTDDVKTYITSNRTRMVDITIGVNNIPYMRIYNFYDGELIFAYWEGVDQHRLYFKDGRLFRWRHTPTSGTYIDYDNRFDLAEFREWEQRVFQDIEDLRIG